MAEAVVSFVVERLGDLLIEEARFLHGVGGQAQEIHNELRWMKAFLKDADARQNEDERIRIWVADVRTLAYDAGDVLESFLLGVESKRGGGIRGVLKRYVCILNECVVRHKTGSKMQGIKDRISNLKSHLDTYRIRSLLEGSSSVTERQSQLRRSYSHVGQDDFVGLGRDVEDLVAQLVSDEYSEKYYQVVSICGMGGLGKTTLAQKIYNHPKIKRHFVAFAWVCVSQQWQTKEVLQQILIKLVPEQRDLLVNLREEELIKRLFDVQKDKLCLVILDDIWSKDAWDCLRPAFHVGKRSSKLLLTSRNSDVATHVDPAGLLYQPRTLDDDECWELLKKKAFAITDRIDMKEVEKMEKLGKEMIRHCGGLPLAVIVLGGLLVTKQSLRGWEKVHQSVKSYIRSGDRDREGGGVQDILILSYNELPYHLKPCFLYLGQFFEDSEIEVERLYQMWIAESMVRSDDRREGETMMDVAESYLGDLAQRCMVQVKPEEDESELRKFKSCRLHDLMRDLCLSKAKEEEFFHIRHHYDHELVKTSYSSSLLTNNNRMRRLVIQDDSKYIFSGDAGFFINKETSKHPLRSLLLTSVSANPFLFMPRKLKFRLNHFKLLRVLAIEGVEPYDNQGMCRGLDNKVISFCKLPIVIGNLKLVHLRYLSMRNCFFPMFPSISNLKQLQTLDLWGCISYDRQRMENVLGKMGSLQHLYLPEYGPITERESKLRLVGLSKLETLENFKSWWCDMEDLFKLQNLRKLSATVVTYSSEANRKAERIVHYLTCPNQLQHSSLSLSTSDSSGFERQIIAPLFGCVSMRTLSINGALGNKLPTPNNFSPSLSKLILNNSRLEEDPMAMLEKLPNLRILILHKESYLGKEMICSFTGFLKLRELYLERLCNLEKCFIHEGAMPNLARLTVLACTKLEELPDGLRFITTLKELQLTDMSSEFKKRLRIIDGEKGEDFHKIQHVPSLIISKSLF